MLQQNHEYAHQQMPQQSLEEVYVQQRHKQQPNHVGMMGPSSLPNHQSPPIPRVSELPLLARSSQAAEQAAYMSRSLPETQMHSQTGPLTSIDLRNPSRPSYDFAPIGEAQIEKVSHSYDAYGQQVPTREEEENARISEEPEHADTDGWNFNDSSEPGHEESTPPEYAPPQRPAGSDADDSRFLDHEKPLPKRSADRQLRLRRPRCGLNTKDTDQRPRRGPSACRFRAARLENQAPACDAGNCGFDPQRIIERRTAALICHSGSRQFPAERRHSGLCRR